MIKGLIGDIGRYAVHDGPGLRTTVFFKGCPLHCPWCHNPEFIADRPEIAFYQEHCIGCGDCQTVCPVGAIDFSGKGERLNRQLCSGCGQCVEQCPALALRLVGQWYTVESLTEIILRDHLFYETSNGGVTLSGGEPTRQLAFVRPLLQGLKSHGLHTAIQTCGLFSWDAFADGVLDLLDLVYFDMKFFNSAEHTRWLGHDNATIISNLQRLVRARPKDVIVRIPLVPGYTATRENIACLADLLQGLNVSRIVLLPYHPWGISKAAKVGKKVGNDLPATPMDSQDLCTWRQYFRQAEPIV